MVAVAVRRLGGALHAGRQLPNLRAEPSDLLRRLGDVAGVELDPRFAHRPGDGVAVAVAAGGAGRFPWRLAARAIPPAPARAAPPARSGIFPLLAASPALLAAPLTTCPASLALSSTTWRTASICPAPLLGRRPLPAVDFGFDRAFAWGLDFGFAVFRFCELFARLGAARFFAFASAIRSSPLSSPVSGQLGIPTRLPAGKSAAVDAGGALDDFEGTAGDPLELVEVLVVPAGIAAAADVPVGAVVGDDHAVALHRRRDHLRLAAEA